MNVRIPLFGGDRAAAPQGAERLWPGLCLMLMAATFCCKSGHQHGQEVEPRTEVTAATQPPPLLTGPCSVILTNADQYSGHLVMGTGTPGGPESPPLYTGNLFHQFGQLLFVPMKEGSLAP